MVPDKIDLMVDKSDLSRLGTFKLTQVDFPSRLPGLVTDTQYWWVFSLGTAFSPTITLYLLAGRATASADDLPMSVDLADRTFDSMLSVTPAVSSSELTSDKQATASRHVITGCSVVSNSCRLLEQGIYPRPSAAKHRLHPHKHN